jgi:hypothetical protein
MTLMAVFLGSCGANTTSRDNDIQLPFLSALTKAATDGDLTAYLLASKGVETTTSMLTVENGCKRQ